MKTYTHRAMMAVVCSVALASCATQPETTRIPVSASLRPDSSKTGQVLEAVNSYRRSQGASELQRHPGLDRLAQEHCEYLRKNRGTFQLYGKNVSHMGFEGRALVAKERYQMNNVSENVASASSPGGNVGPMLVKLWSASKAHESNMRNSWTHTGVGMVVDSDGTVFCTQLFATVSYSQLATRERFSRF